MAASLPNGLSHALEFRLRRSIDRGRSAWDGLRPKRWRQALLGQRQSQSDQRRGRESLPALRVSEGLGALKWLLRPTCELANRATARRPSAISRSLPIRFSSLLPKTELAEDGVEQIFRRGLAHDFS